MRFSENRKLAVAVLVLCVLVSVFALGGIGLARERAKVMRVFDEGTDTSLSLRHSMDAYLDSAAESAKLMAYEAELHLGSSPVIDAVSELATTVADEASLDARSDAYDALKADVDKLYNQMYSSVQGNDLTNFKVAYDDFWGYDNMIGFDEYHKLARSYNAMAGGFPGRLVALVTGLGKLNTFGG